MIRKLFLCFFFCLFFFSCKKQKQTIEESSFVHDDHIDEQIMNQIEGVENTLFYELWENDSLLVFEKLPDIEKRIVYKKTKTETEEYVTRHYEVMLDAHKQIIKLSEIDKLNDNSLRTITVAYFDREKLVFIEFLNDMIEEPAMSYFIKSKINDNQFVPGCFLAKTRINFGNQSELSIDKVSTECIFNALVVYDRMADIYSKN